MPARRKAALPATRISFQSMKSYSAEGTMRSPIQLESDTAPTPVMNAGRLWYSRAASMLPTIIAAPPDERGQTSKSLNG
jgi:hypothetical protein